MKILHIGNFKSGIDTYVRNTISYVNDRFNFVIVGGADDNSKPFLKDGKELKYYKICLYRALNPIDDVKALFQTISIIKRECPDIIHCHSAKGGIIGRLAGFITKTTVLYTPHAFSYLSTNSKLKSKLFLLIERITKFKSKLLACSDSELKLGNESVGYSSTNSYVWNNSIPDIKHDEIQDIHMLDCQEQYIVSVGRPSYQKNPLLMVEIMKLIHEKYPNIKFYLVGVGYHAPMFEDMKQLIDKYHLNGTIKLVPWLTRNETLSYIKHSLMYLSTSLYEGLPIAVLEAMALGKCIIASEVIGNCDCVKNGYNGFLLPLTNPQLYADKIIELLENKELIQEIENNSISYFNKKFSLKNRIGCLENIYITNNK